MSKVLTERIGRLYFSGSSAYLLLDSTIKDILMQELGEPLDRQKHDVKYQTSINKQGKRFVAFWFEKKTNSETNNGNSEKNNSEVES